jgi:predicted XRE-type DNA-binding protein
MKAGLYASFFDHIADTPGEATTLGARAELIEKTEAVITESGWTQAKAAARCGVTQPRFNDLLCAQGSRSPLDALGNIATALGRQVRDEMDAAQVVPGYFASSGFLAK